MFILLDNFTSYNNIVIISFSVHVASPAVQGPWDDLAKEWSSPTGIAIVVVFGVALGVTIGASSLAMAYICIKRYRYECFEYLLQYSKYLFSKLVRTVFQTDISIM